MNSIIQPISPLWEAFPTSKPQETENAAAGSCIFTDIFRSAINNVRETEDAKAKDEYLLATGQLDNPSELLLSLQKADVATNLLVQLRDKVLNAYSELSRISV